MALVGFRDVFTWSSSWQEKLVYRHDRVWRCDAGKVELEEAEQLGLLGPKAVAGEQTTVLVSTHFTGVPAGLWETGFVVLDQCSKIELIKSYNL